MNEIVACAVGWVLASVVVSIAFGRAIRNGNELNEKLYGKVDE